VAFSAEAGKRRLLTTVAARLASIGLILGTRAAASNVVQSHMGEGRQPCKGDVLNN
jgi:hypothetical protein